MSKQLLLKDRYLVLEELGSGGFGDVYLAEDMHLPSRRRCVVKHLSYPEKGNDPKKDNFIRQRFEREAAILEKLSKSIDQIPKLYAYFAEANEMFIVMEWIEGKTLQDHWGGQVLSQEEVTKLLLDLLNILEQLHKHRLIHRELSLPVFLARCARLLNLAPSALRILLQEVN